MVRILPLIFVLTVVSAAQAQSTPPEPMRLSLSDARRLALSIHPNAARAGFDIAARAKAVDIATAPLLPQIGISAASVAAGPNSRIAAPGGINDPTVIGRNSFGLALSQLVTDFGRTEDIRRAAQSDLAAAEEGRTLTQSQIILDVSLSYYDALRVAQLVNVAEQTVKQANLLRDQIEALQKVKLRSALDLAVAEQNAAEAKQFLLLATDSRDGAMTILSAAMGYRERQSFILEDQETGPIPQFRTEDLEIKAEEQNPALRALTRAFDASRLRARAAEEAFNPTVQVQAYIGATPQHASDQKIANTYAVGGLTISVPIYSGEALSATAGRAKFESAGIAAQLSDQRNRLLRDVRLAENSVATAYTNIGLSLSLLDTSKRTFELVKARYDIGSSSIIDLSAAQLRLTEASIKYSNAKFEYLKKMISLEFLTGDLKS
jgi:outer membrane protein